jgi:hypothetical protein
MQQVLSKAFLALVLLTAGFRVLTLQAQLEPIQIPGKFDLSGRTELSQPGFQIRIHQANEDLLNTESEREKVLAGMRPDSLGFPLENFAKETGATREDWILGHTFLAEGAVDLEQDGKAAGAANEEQIIPGIPGFEEKTSFLSAEILMLMEIPEPGSYSFGLNASGGFTVTTGNVNDLVDIIRIAEVDGHQEAITTRFDLNFEQAGIYQFRTIWYTGDGNASFEWWTLDSEENRVLLNTEGGLRTFSNQPDPLTSFVRSTPSPDAKGVLLNQSALEIEIKHDLSSVSNDSITATLNGEPVTPQIQLTGDTLNVSIELNELSAFTQYDWTIGFDSESGTREIASSFTTAVFGAEGLLFIEAEDFDFGRGQWEQRTPTGMTGAYPGGAYRNRGNGAGETDVDADTDFGVDYFEDPSTNGKPLSAYRPDTGVETVRRTSQEDTKRGTFSVITNHSVTDNNKGEWLNYTREFPLSVNGSKFEYHIFVRASSEGTPIHASLGLVSENPESGKLTVNTVALLNPGRATADSNTFELFPLRETDSQPGEGDALARVELGGTEVLRMTTLAESSHDLDYFLFLPAASTVEPGEIISFARDGNNLVIEYLGTLKSAASLASEYTPVKEASSPFTVVPENSQTFFIAE